ncbi:MAG: maleylpyruvate isomerase family mycothiol-dependent enzyme [Nocardioides sp.]
MEPWTANDAGRKAFASYLETLTPTDWAAPSWCAAWDVKAVAAHLLVTQTKGKGEVFFSFLASGFNLDKMNAKYVGQLTGSMSPEQIVAATRETAGVRSAPPGLSPAGVHGELAVHATDISAALGGSFALPGEHYALALDHFKGAGSPLGCKKRIDGLRLEATDIAWSTGNGPVVEGTGQMLLAAMTGRHSALAHLSGPGAEALAGRP